MLVRENRNDCTPLVLYAAPAPFSTPPCRSVHKCIMSLPVSRRVHRTNRHIFESELRIRISWSQKTLVSWPADWKSVARSCLCWGCLFFLAAGERARAIPQLQDVPIIDGGAGPCSVELTVTDPGGKPVYAATIRVHIAYGFGGIRKLDLEAGTNSDGKAKFVGLPRRVRNNPLSFKASKGEESGAASFDPATECQGKHDILLQKQQPQPKTTSSIP